MKGHADREEAMYMKGHADREEAMYMKGHADREEAMYMKTQQEDQLEDQALGSPGLSIPPEDITERIPVSTIIDSSCIHFLHTYIRTAVHHNKYVMY